MFRFALAMFCVFGTGCFVPLPGDDINDDAYVSPPPPVVRSVCGNGKLESGETCDDGNLVGGDGCSANCRRDYTVHVSWQLATLAGELQPCPAGFDVAEVIAQAGAFAVPLKTRFDCAAGSGDVVVEEAPAPEISHDIHVVIKSSASGEVYGESSIDHLDITKRTDSRHTIVTDAGMISVSWNVYVGNQPTSCPGVTSIDVVVRGAAGVLFMQSFPCSAGVGVTPLLLAGSYSVDVSARSGTQSASVTLDGITVPIGGKTVRAGPANLMF